LQVLEAVERRLLRLASIVHYANKIRPNRSGMKVEAEALAVVRSWYTVLRCYPG
jgi:hypothetical protein